MLWRKVLAVPLVVPLVVPLLEESVVDLHEVNLISSRNHDVTGAIETNTLNPDRDGS